VQAPSKREFKTRNDIAKERLMTRTRILSLAVLAAIALGAVPPAAAVTTCDNEPIPRDIPITIGDPDNPPAVQVGVDTDSQNANGWRGLCVWASDGSTTVNTTISVDHDTTATPGARFDVQACLNGVCNGTGEIGAEAGNPWLFTIDGEKVYLGPGGTFEGKMTGVYVVPFVVPWLFFGEDVPPCVGTTCTPTFCLFAGFVFIYLEDEPTDPSVTIPLAVSRGMDCPGDPF